MKVIYFYFILTANDCRRSWRRNECSSFIIRIQESPQYQDVVSSCWKLFGRRRLQRRKWLWTSSRCRKIQKFRQKTQLIWCGKSGTNKPGDNWTKRPFKLQHTFSNRSTCSPILSTSQPNGSERDSQLGKQ